MATNDNSNQNEIMPGASLKESVNKTFQEAEETIKAFDEVRKNFETLFGTIQAFNTADDLLFKSPAPAADYKTPSSSPAKEALAVYQGLSEEEWKKYFNLLNTTRLKQKEEEQLRTYIIKSTEKEPYLRRLVRETIQHGKPITISSTPEDWEALKKKNCLGDADWSTRHIRLLPEKLTSGTVFHEILHIGQEDDGLEKDASSREALLSRRKYIEAEARSVSYLCEQQKHNYPNNYLGRLIEQNEKELRENQQDIPSDLTDEEKELFIHTQAVNRAIGASIHILMQPEGKATEKTASDYGIKLTDRDLRYYINDWKRYYNNDDKVKEWICQVFPSYKTTATTKDHYVYNYVTKRYPVLKGKDFLVIGLTNEERKKWGFPPLPVSETDDSTTGIADARGTTDRNRHNTIEGNNSGTTKISQISVKIIPPDHVINSSSDVFNLTYSEDQSNEIPLYSEGQSNTIAQKFNFSFNGQESEDQSNEIPLYSEEQSNTIAQKFNFSFNGQANGPEKFKNESLVTKISLMFGNEILFDNKATDSHTNLTAAFKTNATEYDENKKISLITSPETEKGIA